MNKSDPSQNDGTAKVIALLPRDDDPVRQIASGDHPHTTLFYLGDGETDMEELKKLVKAAADLGYTYPDPFDMIAGEGTLGVEGAHVYFLDARFSEKVRSQMEVDPWLQSELNKAEQFPTWTPHMTIGYPDAPAERVSERPDGIVYDRIAIFDQGEVIEYPFDFTDADDQPEEDTESVTASAEVEEDEELAAAVAELQDQGEDVAVPIKGILAPEGVPSSDNRMFSEGALTAREVPIPLRWVERDSGGHDNAVIVGRMDKIFREDGVIKFQGVMDTSAPAYEAVRLIANGMLRGVSVDVSDVVAAEGDDEVTEFSSAKIAAATLVAIPAFSEAFVSLGYWDEGEEADQEKGEFAISEKSWDGSASRFTEEEYHRSCLIHEHPDGEPSKSACKLPIREPNGDINKNGVHAAASRIDQVDASEEEKSKAKSKLKSAYREIGEEPPEQFADVEFADKLLPKHMDGPGWITEPKPTKRITSYWVDGRGAAKIRWGQGGDFNRCRRQLAKYVKNPDWLAGLCANLHHRALGIWPGQHSLESSVIASASPSVTFSPEKTKGQLPAEWFKDPKLDQPTPLTVTDDGRVFGHIASWNVCHIGFTDDCVIAPRSITDYSYFRTGEVDTTEGPVAVGNIVMGGPHADPKAKMRAAFVHYASTSSALADVNVGEDEHGIWIAGALRDSVSADDLRSLKASGLSGDWRHVRANGQANLELVAALAVNVQGFPIPRPSLAASGEMKESLVAASPVVDSRKVMNRARISEARSTLRASRAAMLKTELGL